MTPISFAASDGHCLAAYRFDPQELSGEPGAREAYATADYPVLTLSFSDDELLLEAGSRLLHGAYRRRAVDYRLVDPASLGLARMGHFGFFKPQSEAALWPLVADWMECTAG